jgi:hypothetical protein
MLPVRPSYRRVQAPIYHRPTTWFAQGLRRFTGMRSLGGIRSYSDDPLKPGRLLEMDVFVPGKSEVTLLVEVEWCVALAGGVPARFDVGMRIVRMESRARAHLDGVLALD